ncbi:MAG TPA: BrnA antitoxin family protein [Dissulfurispiraceae bacterium]|nr:BrnA antitoxin family protein [Dissulfurispiraceae bacterium]
MKKTLIDDSGEVRELTDEDFKKMRPARDVVPQIVKAYQEGRLRVRGPQKTPKKSQMTLRLSQDVVSFFKSKGRGWQTKIDNALKEYVKTHS